MDPASFGGSADRFVLCAQVDYDSLLSMSRNLAKRQRAVNGRSASAESFSALAAQILVLAAALDGAGDDLTRPAGQSSARWLVMAAVEHEPATVASIARALSHTRQSVQRIADAIVASGLAEFAANPAHRRAQLLTLTADGAGTLHLIQAAQARWAEAVSDGLDSAQLDNTRAVLAELQRRIADAHA